MASKSSAQFRGLSSFINSPGFGKFFKISIAALILLAAIYGGYAVYKQNFGHAASDVWYYNSGGITHSGGKLGYFRVGQGNIYDSPPLGTKSGSSNQKVWYASDISDRNKFIWSGPGKHLTPGHPYLGCFYYAFQFSGEATLNIINNDSGKTLRTYDIEATSATQPSKAGTFNRACLAFYVPNTMDHNHIDLRVYYMDGTLGVFKTTITLVTSQNNDLPLGKLLTPIPDNKTILFTYGFVN